MARSVSSARRRRPGSIRSSVSRSSCSIRPSRTRTGSSSRHADRAAAARPGRPRPTGRGSRRASPPDATEGLPARPRPDRARLPGHRAAGQGGPARDRGAGPRPAPRPARPFVRSAGGACAGSSRTPTWPARRAMPRFSQALLAEHTEGLVALSGCRDGELARRLRTGDLAGARAVAERYATLFGRGDGPATSGFFIELSHHLLPDDDWLVARVGGAGRGHRPAGRRHQRRPLRPARGPRAGRRPDRDPARPVARHARRPAPARWRVVPEVGRGAGGARAVARAMRRPRPGRRGSRRRSSSRRRARSISASSSTASPASRSPTGRPRSRTCRSCAGRAPGSATTR